MSFAPSGARRKIATEHHGTNLPAIPREQLRGIVERDSLALLGIASPSGQAGLPSGTVALRNREVGLTTGKTPTELDSPSVAEVPTES